MFRYPCRGRRYGLRPDPFVALRHFPYEGNLLDDPSRFAVLAQPFGFNQIFDISRREHYPSTAKAVPLPLGKGGTALRFYLNRMVLINFAMSQMGRRGDSPHRGNVAKRQKGLGVSRTAVPYGFGVAVWF